MATTPARAVPTAGQPATEETTRPPRQPTPATDQAHPKAEAVTRGLRRAAELSLWALAGATGGCGAVAVLVGVHMPHLPDLLTSRNPNDRVAALEVVPLALLMVGIFTYLAVALATVPTRRRGSPMTRRRSRARSSKRLPGGRARPTAAGARLHAGRGRACTSLTTHRRPALRRGGSDRSEGVMTVRDFQWD